jgi:DNA-binding response OmpR family regulator
MSDLRFLIVEDDLFYQTYVNDLLAETGVDIVNASDGEAGLALALSEKPDLIITDIEIPKIQGFVLLKNLRENPETKDIPVIMMSGKVEKDLLERHSRLSSHADGYLMKPFSGQDLIDLIRKVIDVDFKSPDPEPKGQDTADGVPAEAVIEQTTSGSAEGSQSGIADSSPEEPDHHDASSNGSQAPDSSPDKVHPVEGAGAISPNVRASGPLRALIVDDSKYILDIGADFLNEIGAEVTTASDGEEGFNLAMSIVPDIILLDVQMPGLNGFVVCEKLKKEAATAEVPVILMSAVVDDESFQRHAKLRYHADAYLQKPFMKSELQDLVASFTSTRLASTGNVESKTGFLVPSEDEDLQLYTQQSGTGSAAAQKLAEELKKSRETIGIAQENERRISAEIEAVRKERDGFEEQLYNLKKTVDSREKELNDKLTLTSHRHEESRQEVERLSAEISGLREQLEGSGDGSANTESIKALEVRLEQSGTEIDRLAGQVSELTAQLEDKSVDTAAAEKLAKMESLLVESKNNLDLSVSENEMMRSQLSDTRELDELKKQVGELTPSLESATAKLEEIAVLNQKLELEVQTSEEKEETTRRLEEITAAAGKSEEARLALERDLAAAVAAKNEIEEQVKSLITDSREAGKSATDPEEVESLRQENKELAVRVSEAESKTKWLAEVEKQLETVQKEADELREELEGGPGTDNSQKLVTLQEQLDVALEKAEELEGVNEQLSITVGELEVAREERDELSNKVKSLEVELTESSNIAEQQISSEIDTDGRVELLLQEKGLMEEDLDEARKLLDKADENEDRVAELEAEMESEKALRFDAEQEVEKLRSAETPDGYEAKRITELESDLNEARKLLDKADENENRVAELEAELESAKALVSTVEEEIEELRSSKTPDGYEAKRIAELEADLNEARKLLHKADENEDRVAELEGELESEKALRSATEDEVKELSSLEAGIAEDSEKIAELEAARKELVDSLDDMREERDQMAAKVSMLKVAARKATSEDEGKGSETESRLEELEQVLSHTVTEAQNALKEQNYRELALEESVESLMRSLEEERAISTRDRDRWQEREDELKDAFEDALRESRRLMGEEAARLYPMHIPRQARPLEVVTGMKKYGIAVGLAVAAVAIFISGHFILSGPKQAPESTAVSSSAQREQAPASANNPSGQARPPMPYIATTSPADSYESLWRSNTVQSVSEDMMLQATFHTKQELEAAITYTASKEGWTTERLAKAMGDLARTYDLERSYYVTVYSKNLKGGYPGYADNFERHIALRDGSGVEVRAVLPEILERSKFITSRVSAAGKEMNPVFLYEVGLTVAFPKKELGQSPGGLQLVLYDVGAVPMRVLTWDMGAVSYNFRGNGTALERRSS